MNENEIFQFKLLENETYAISKATTIDKNITSISIPNEYQNKPVTKIDSYAFNSLEKLHAIEIPNTITYIGSAAFSNCYSLTKLEIPTSVEYIGDRILDNCLNIESLTIPFIGQIRNDTNIKNLAYIFNGSKNYQIPRSLKEITITDSYIIKEKVFDSCNGLAKIEFSGKTKIIEANAFSSCYGLVTVVISEGVEHIGKEAFARCTSLKNIYIPRGIKKIEDSAFGNQARLENIYFGGNVKDWLDIEIGSHLFSYEAEEIKSDNKYDFVTRYTEEKPLNLYMMNDLGKYELVTELIIPSGVTSIGKDKFCNFASIKTVKMANTVEKIEYSAFWKCANLERVILPLILKTIEGFAFGQCKKLTNVTIPLFVHEIGYKAFAFCPELTVNCEIKKPLLGYPKGYDKTCFEEVKKVVWNCKK